MKRSLTTLLERTKARLPAIQQHAGPLTEELVQTPGRFGLGRVPVALAPDGAATSICGFCSTGCSLKIHLRQGAAINLTPDPLYPVNLGMACPKGWESLAPLAAADRATSPLLRDESGGFQPVTWDTAMRTFAGRLKAIQEEHGPDSVAWIGTGQMPNEELAFLGALAKFGMGIRHGDGNTRQCMATAVAAYKQSFGFDAPPYTYADFEESDVIVLVGSNLCITHPILWQRILRNPHTPEIIVIDPRSTETALSATQHYPILPKSDLTLFYALAQFLIEEDAVDDAFVGAHTSGYEDFADHVTPFTPQRVVLETGLSMAHFLRLAVTIKCGKRVSFWWTMGVNQGHQATRTAQAIINLALMKGNIGKPGTGANSITGQCNAMGSRLFSNTTNLLGGHDFLNPAHRAKVASTLGIPEETIPHSNSLAYDEILDRVEAGEIKALWIIATNTAHSWIEQTRAREALRKLKFLVVQDMYATSETAQQAHLVLPAAGWGEKEGTFINSERRIGVLRKVSRAPGEALSDFNIFKLVAAYWGCADLFAAWETPEAVFRLLTKVTEGQPCDISGITGYEMLEAKGGVQWPCPKGLALNAQHRRLFEDGKFYTPNGRAKFHFVEPQAPPEPVDAAYPFVLLTGRGSSAQWHTQTRTGKSAVLRKLHPHDCYVEIHANDAKRLRLKPGQKVRVKSRRGELIANAVISPTVQVGQLFIPMHYHEANRLTLTCVDPHSRQPSYKHCAVALEAAKD
ncbi:MAG TPA: nitrate reductase [Methylomirabilota bacterium]|nr:nitrate reductase [Methylomirabilota bacterium]